MARVKRSTTATRRHKRLIARAKGFRHTRKNVFRLAKQAVMKAEQYAYASRRTKKRSIKRLWIIRINAACKANDVKYSRFIKSLDDNKIPVNRKELSQMAQEKPDEFKKLVDRVKP